MQIGQRASFDKLRTGRAKGIEMEVGGAALRALRLEAESRGQKAKSIGHERLKILDLRFQIDLKKNRRSDRSREVPL